jgi:hypothetical protein
VEACNAVAVPEPIRAALVRDLGPVAKRLAGYSDVAKSLEVSNQGTADQATIICNDIAADIKAVKDHEVLSRITDGLHKLHRQWTGLRDLFIAPMERDRRTIKAKVIAWQEGERRKAEEAQRKLQAEADAKAAREREALLKKAAAVKTPEKQEAYREAAAAIVPPTIHVAAPKSGLRTQTVWKVKSIDAKTFFAAASTRPDLQGFAEIKTVAMERTKAANPNTEIPGVVFEKVTR